MKNVLSFVLVTLLLAACTNANSTNPNSGTSGSDNASEGQPDRTPEQTRESGTTTP